jgi:phenylalanyl-tRNA synthetase beta chain
MKIVYNWLREFVDVTGSPDELASRLALSGTNIASIETGPHGPVIDAEVGSNRPDCLSHLGIAREVGAVYKLPLKFTAPTPAVSATAKAADAVRVDIQSPELCGRYTARVIRGVKIQPSPKWLKDRLEASGVASISNIVDITNYVMLELGNPMHAFDLDRVRDHHIVIRRARPGEKMQTLDGIERVMDPGMPLVCDGDGSRSIGSGVMGGATTEISSSTKSVLLECAWFDPISIRCAARSMKLHTEASTRFGRGADPEMAEVASRRAAELIVQLAGGELLSGVVDVYPGKRPPTKIRLTRPELLRVMGADVPDKSVESILYALGFAPVRVDQNRGAAGSLLAAWECTQPSWRAEVEREIDLVEEVARVYGLDKFPPRLPAARQGAHRLPHHEAEMRLRERLIGLGYREIVTIPHVSEDRDALFRPAGVTPARISNPLSEEASVLRSTGIVTMVNTLEWNLNHGQRNVRLFEIGHHYRLHGHQSVETRVLTIGASGEAREKGLYDDAREYQFADLKGDLDAIGSLPGGFGTSFGASFGGSFGGGWAWSDAGPDWLHAARRGTAVLSTSKGDTVISSEARSLSFIGVAGQLARRIADKFKLRQDVFLAEIELDPLYSALKSQREGRRYEPLPRFPSVERDFSLLLADGTHFSEVGNAIASLRIDEIVSIEAGDLFRGKNVPAGKYSLLVRVTFQSRDSTLTEAQISDASARIVAALEKALSAQLRAS